MSKLDSHKKLGEPVLQLYGAKRAAHTVIAGNLLRALREQKNLTARELAIKVNKSTSYVGMIERGERHINKEYLVESLRALGTKPRISADQSNVTVTYMPGAKVQFNFTEALDFTDDTTSQEMTPMRASRLSSIIKQLCDRPWLIDSVDIRE